MEKECQKTTKATSVAIHIFKGKGDIMNCGMCMSVELLEHTMKIAVKLLYLRKYFEKL